MGVTDLGPLSKEGVRLVEQQDGLNPLRGIENFGEVLLRLADPLRDYTGDVHDQEVRAHCMCHDFGGERLAGARGAGEEHAYSTCAGPALQKTPIVQHLGLKKQPAEGLT